MPGRAIHAQGSSCSRSLFFFSSRRRHTRLQGDWSSDVCSSDLFSPAIGAGAASVVGIALFVLLASPLRVLNNDPPELRLHLWSDGLRMIGARPLTDRKSVV